MNECIRECCQECKSPATCKTVNTQYADVSLPVKVKPFACLGEIETECCCDPLITLRQGVNGQCSCTCELLITQTLCIKIPVEYGTHVEVGETVVNCRTQQSCNI